VVVLYGRLAFFNVVFVLPTWSRLNSFTASVSRYQLNSVPPVEPYNWSTVESGVTLLHGCMWALPFKRPIKPGPRMLLTRSL